MSKKIETTVPGIFICPRVSYASAVGGERMKGAFEEILEWWRGQTHRYFYGSVDQDKHDEIFQQELLPKLGVLLQSLYPGSGYCEVCKWPWVFVTPHMTRIDEYRSCFVVCERCWPHVERKSLLDLYDEAGRRYGWPESDIEAAKANLRDAP